MEGLALSPRLIGCFLVLGHWWCTWASLHSLLLACILGAFSWTVSRSALFLETCPLRGRRSFWNSLEMFWSPGPWLSCFASQRAMPCETHGLLFVLLRGHSWWGLGNHTQCPGWNWGQFCARQVPNLLFISDCAVLSLGEKGVFNRTIS